MNLQTVKEDIRQLKKQDIENVLSEWSEAKFRAKQIYDWIWKRSVTSFEEMTNVSKELRSRLEERFEFRSIREDMCQHSSDGTIKTRFTLHDGNKIESVLIPVVEDNRFTVCVSSQVGCSLNCSFCATGKMKRMRNLDPGEIYDQVKEINLQSQQKFGHPITNIVFMGMGEPLLNYTNVMKAIELISSEDGLGMSSKRITISTAGIAKMIMKLADDNAKVKLAISLHAADDTKRNQIMPINESNNLEALMEALEYYYLKSKNKISYEYISFKNFNDSVDDARNLVKLCTRFPVLVNIIEYNPIDGVDFIKSNEDTIDGFAAYVRKKGIMITVRKSRGKDIDAACGQLANKE